MTLLPADTFRVILLVGLAFLASRPWRSQDEAWFDHSALIAALLFGAPADNDACVGGA
jgi:hypothetical protein